MDVLWLLNWNRGWLGWYRINKTGEFQGEEVPMDVISVTNSVWLRVYGKPYNAHSTVQSWNIKKLISASQIANQELGRQVGFVEIYTLSSCGKFGLYYRQILVYLFYIRHTQNSRLLACVWFKFPTTLSILGQLIYKKSMIMIAYQSTKFPCTS